MTLKTAKISLINRWASLGLAAMILLQIQVISHYQESICKGEEHHCSACELAEQADNGAQQVLPLLSAPKYRTSYFASLNSQSITSYVSARSIRAPPSLTQLI